MVIRARREGAAIRAETSFAEPEFAQLCIAG
jgi:hypothetical protein